MTLSWTKTTQTFLNQICKTFIVIQTWKYTKKTIQTNRTKNNQWKAKIWNQNQITRYNKRERERDWPWQQRAGSRWTCSNQSQAQLKFPLQNPKHPIWYSKYPSQSHPHTTPNLTNSLFPRLEQDTTKKNPKKESKKRLCSVYLAICI